MSTHRSAGFISTILSTIITRGTLGSFAIIAAICVICVWFTSLKKAPVAGISVKMELHLSLYCASAICSEPPPLSAPLHRIYPGLFGSFYVQHENAIVSEAHKRKSMTRFSMFLLDGKMHGRVQKTVVCEESE